MGKNIIDRCNLVVLFEKGQEDLASFLADNKVDIIASLPCYTEGNTNKQRGRDVFKDRHYGITFSSLFVLTNMPIKRFADSLIMSQGYVSYMQLLANAFNGGTVKGLMCKDTVNVAWDGKLYDCDFNAAIGIGSCGLTGEELDIWSIGE
ncbi:hypothetical protein LTR39_000057 [Cryomyces antarcticus]|nr:hypothetical protein LTR39_000057 [Cryomyces antarcticus]